MFPGLFGVERHRALTSFLYNLIGQGIRFMRNYVKLIAWRMGMEISRDVYLLTKKYPKDEVYGLVSQTKRAATGVPANIAEGMGREHRNDTIRFLFIARGSLYELDTLLMIALSIGIITKEEYKIISDKIEKAYMTLNGLIKYFKKGNLV